MQRIRWPHVALVSAGGLLFIAPLLLYLTLFADLPNPAQVQGTVDVPSILIDDRHGQLLYEVIDPDGNKHVPVPLAQIPPACRQATIATEDSHFYAHPGVDPIAIVRAAWGNWRQGYTVSGASTLTQQLARNLYLSEEERVERSLRRKLREAWLAWRLEQLYTKDELLARYLNTTYYGHFAVGIEAAAQAYFGMHAAELDLAQCALLAGLPQYPQGYNPIENPEAARYRQRVVLGLMVKDGYISAAQAENAQGERMAYASAPFTIEAPHFVMWVQSQLEEMLGPERLRQGGLRVTTTLDLDWQRQAEAIVRRRLRQLRPCADGLAGDCDPDASPARRVDNAALVALDPASGEILAMVGSPDYFDPAISGAVNAALSSRQPGSAIKPLTYAAAFDPQQATRAGRTPWTPATLIADVRTVFPTQEGKPYVPQNYDLRYHGPVTARTALANSYNIPAVKALQHIGVDALIAQAAALGVPFVSGWEAQIAYPEAGTSPSGYGLALTLGGGEVRLLDLTTAYAAFANLGYRVEPRAILRIETLEGDLIFDAQDIPKGEWRISSPATRSTPHASQLTHHASFTVPILDPRVAYLITDILSDETARLPAFGPGNVLEIGRPAAAKTGTTTDWRDNWTVGYTPDLVVGVWVGNADNSPMRDVSGISGAGPIWHDFMIAALRDRPPQPFPQPEGLVRVEICADSGLLPLDRGLTNPKGEPASRPSASSPKSGQSQIANRKSEIVPCPNRRFEWFIAGTEPTEVDTSHVQLAIDMRTGGPAGPSTPPEYVREQTFWVLPDELQDWARENHIPQPPVAAEGEAQIARLISDSQIEAVDLRLTSPDPNRAYRIDPGLPRDAQQLPISAAVDRRSMGDVPVTLLLDDRVLARVTGPDYTAWWPLTPGQHTFRAVAEAGDGREIVSPAVTVFVEP